jgi:DNA-binding CsgD family transcriptional regulator
VEVDDLEGREFDIAQSLAEGLPTPAIAQELGVSESVARSRIRVVLAKLGVSNRRELRAKIDRDSWRREFNRINAFIRTHRHSHVPEGYEDEHGPLEPIVSRIRQHHRGPEDDTSYSRRLWHLRAPFGEIDYASELDRLPGWEW